MSSHLELDVVRSSAELREKASMQLLQRVYVHASQLDLTSTKGLPMWCAAWVSKGRRTEHGGRKVTKASNKRPDKEYEDADCYTTEIFKG
jgi:hypothetical protein